MQNNLSIALFVIVKIIEHIIIRVLLKDTWQAGSIMLPRLTAHNNVGLTSKASEEIRREGTENCRF